MKTEEFFNVLADIDDDMITKAKSSVSDAVGGVVIRRPWKPFAAAAACLAVIIIGAAIFIGVNSREAAVKTVDSGGNSENSGAVSAEYPESAKYQYTGDFSELEPASYSMVDRTGFGYFDDLAKASSLIVVGTFVDDARQDVPLTGKITWDTRSTSLLPGASYNKLRVDRVFKGDVEAGSQIVIRGDYFVNEGELVYVYGAASTPMIKGEQWVYFLGSASAEESDYYSSLGFNDGRFFVPGNENTFVLEELEEYLVGNNMAYEDVKIMLGEPGDVEKLEIKPRLKDTGEFVLPEFPAKIFVKTEKNICLKDTGRFIFHGVNDVYFADLDGDGKREIICTCQNVTSGVGGNFIMAYDHAHSKLYHLKEHLNGDEVRAPLDYGLGINDGVLYAYERSVNAAEVYYEKPLTLDLMTEVDLSDKPITYEGKTYKVVNRLYTEDGVTFTIGLTKPEYEAGEFVEALGIVENNSDKEIGMYTPGINAPFNGEIGVVIKQGDVRLEFDDPYLMDDAIGSTIVKPGERFVHAFMFDTREERLDDKDTIVPLCKPTGIYDGTAGVILFKDPHDTSSETKSYGLNFEVNIRPSADDTYPHRQVFGIEEFGNDVEFELTADSLTANDGSGKFEVFSGMQIKNMYLLDLNGDGKREICANVSSYEKGYAHIAAYDYVNRKLYDLSDPGYYDYHMDILVGYEGGYNISAQKFGYSSAELAADPVRLTLDVMKEVKALSDDRRNPVTGASEITKLGETFTMEEFPGKTFYYADHILKYTETSGEETKMFGSKIDNIYLYDLNTDGRREIIVKGYCDVLHGGNNGTIEPDAEKIIRVIDLENEYDRNIFPHSKECSLVIIDNALYMAIDGETDTEPLSFDRFMELAKSPDL